MKADELKYPGVASAGKKIDGPSLKLKRLLKGDLDNIVLKSLRKEPERRYASVEQLAEDIRRHLQGLPVSAAPDSFSYRAGKFISRNKLGVVATALILLAVCTGVVATVYEARIAAANEHRAQQRFNDVRKLANSLMFEIHDSIRDLPGSTPARRLLVTRALEYLDGLSQQSQGDTSLQKELAAAYERVGDVLGYPYAANLGDQPGALQSYRKALTIREALAVASPNNVQLQSDLAVNYFRITHVLEASGDFKGALGAMRKALSITQRLAAVENTSVRADQLAGSYYFIAGLLVQTGDPDGALENYQRGASIRQSGLERDPGYLSLRTHLAADYAGVASLLAKKGDLGHATQTQEKAIAILEDASKANPNSAGLREFLGEAISRIATFRKNQGNTAAALESFSKAHLIFRDLMAADSKNILAKTNFAFTDNGIALSLVELGKPASAIGVFREAIATFEEMSPRSSSNHYLRSGLADSYSKLGEAYSALAVDENIPTRQRQEYWRQGRSTCEKSLALWQLKQKLGELESGEHREAQQVAQCIAKCDSQLGVSRLGKNNLH